MELTQLQALASYLAVSAGTGLMASLKRLFAGLLIVIGVKMLFG